MLPGCLVDDPPPYPEPKQTPPRLDYARAFPPLNQIINARTDDIIPFKIYASSEDAGDSLKAYLILDFTAGTTPDELKSVGLPASTLDDTERYFDLTWQVRRVSQGCHKLTLRVSHSLNLPNLDKPPVNATDVAEAYWWLFVDADPSQINSLLDCPTPKEGP